MNIKVIINDNKNNKKQLSIAWGVHYQSDWISLFIEKPKD